MRVSRLIDVPQPIHRNALRPDQRLQWYVVKRVLGQGGFGITYLARDENLAQDVAIKEYLPIELAVRERDDSVHPMSGTHEDKYQWGLHRFVQEARTLAKFDHPNLVRVLSVFEHNNTAYMVMRYERGQTLQELLTDRKTLEESEIMRLLVPLLGGLETIHAQGFVHRDIKPANIFLRQDGSPVLLDFGAARQAISQESKSLTSLYSPGYAPIEQYYTRKDEQGPWTDVYGTGATLYRCVAGFAPMDAIDRSHSIASTGRDSLKPAAEVAAGAYSSRFLDAIDSAIRFDAGERPRSIGDWLTLLDLPDESKTELNVQASSASRARGVPGGVTWLRRFWSKRRIVVVGVVCALLAVLGGAWLWLASPRVLEFIPPGDIEAASDGSAAGGLTSNRSTWATAYGDLLLTARKDGEIVGVYPQYGGHIYGRLQENELHAFWTEEESEIVCEKEKYGTKNWGRVVFTFDDAFTRFDGRWGYCDTALENEWNGERRGG